MVGLYSLFLSWWIVMFLLNVPLNLLVYKTLDALLTRLQVFRQQKCVSSPPPLGTSSPNTSSNTAQSNSTTPDYGKVAFTEGVDVEQASDV